MSCRPKGCTQAEAQSLKLQMSLWKWMLGRTLIK